MTLVSARLCCDMWELYKVLIWQCNNVATVSSTTYRTLEESSITFSCTWFTREVVLNGEVMEWNFMFPKTALLLMWESVHSTFEWVSLGTFSFLRTQISSVQCFGLQHHAGLQNLWHWRSNIVHSERMRQSCLSLLLLPPNAHRKTFPIFSESWMEECSPSITPTYGSIQLSHFSGIAIIGRKSTARSYCAHLYHTIKQAYDWRFYLVITQDIDAQITVSVCWI